MDMPVVDIPVSSMTGEKAFRRILMRPIERWQLPSGRFTKSQNMTFVTKRRGKG